MRALSEKEIENFFNNHLPYRFEILLGLGRYKINDNPGSHPPLFVASAIACRMFMQFMGLKVDGNSNLIESRRRVQSYDFKITDLGGNFVEIDSLNHSEKNLLRSIYITASKDAAHFTHRDPTERDYRDLKKASNLIKKLLENYLYKKVNREMQTHWRP